MLERVLECGTKIYERSSREWRGESVSPTTETGGLNQDSIGLSWGLPTLTVCFLCSHREKMAFITNFITVGRLIFCMLALSVMKDTKQSFISCRNVHKCYINRQEEMRQEGLRSFHWSLRLSDLSLNGNCNNMSALITCFIFHAISTVWHVSCCTRLGSDPTCQQWERSDVTCWPDKIPILTCPRWRWTVEMIYHRLRHEVRLLPFTTRS